MENKKPKKNTRRLKTNTIRPTRRSNRLGENNRRIIYNSNVGGYTGYDPNNYASDHTDYPRDLYFSDDYGNNSSHSDTIYQNEINEFDTYEKEIQNIIYESYNQNNNLNIDPEIQPENLYSKFLEQPDIDLLLSNTNLFNRSFFLQEKIAPDVFYSEQFKNFFVNILGNNKYESMVMFNIQYHKSYIIKLTDSEKYYEIEKNGMHNFKKFLIDIIGNNEYCDTKKYYTAGFPLKYVSCADDLINLCQTFLSSKYKILIATKSEMITHILSSKLSQIKITSEAQMRKLYSIVRTNQYKIQAFKNYASNFIMTNGSSLDTLQRLHKFIESLPGSNKKDLLITAKIAWLGDIKFVSNFNNLTCSCKSEILDIINFDIIYKFVCGSALVSTDTEMKIFSYLVQQNDRYKNLIFLSEYLNIVDYSNINYNNNFEKMILFYKINCDINLEEINNITNNVDLIGMIRSILNDYEIKKNKLFTGYTL
jgi:hypothetical protein